MIRRFIRSFEVGDKPFGYLTLILFAAFLVHQPVLQYWDDWTTPQPWFQATFTVPDHAPGDDPLVGYQRHINRSVQGLWSVRISEKDEETEKYLYVCSGSGYAYYQTETSGVISMPLSEFVGAPCPMDEGQHRACAIYDLRDERGVRRSFGPYCSEFEVSEEQD